MMSGRILRLSVPLLLFLCISSSCNNDSKPVKKPVSDTSSGALNPEASAEKTAAPTPAPIDTQHHGDLTSTQNTPAPKPLKEAPPPKTDYSKLPGPKGFVTRDNAILRTGPSEKSDKISVLKANETIYLLETTMRNEAGIITEYPTWYKIERENKQRGWVVAAAVDAGGGG